MSIWNSDVYGTIWGAEEKDGKWTVELSTSEKQSWAVAVENEKKYNPKANIKKDKDGKEFFYENSSWGKYVRLASVAAGLGDRLAEKLQVSRPVRIKIPVGKLKMSNAPYYKNGVKTYLKQPSVTLFDFDFVDDGGGQTPPLPPVDDDQIPF